MPETLWSERQRAFADAAGWFVQVAGLVGQRWDEPGLGDWTVRDLVGHTSRSLITVESYLDAGADEVGVASAVDYYLRVRELADSASITQRGRDAGAALGADPVRELHAPADRVIARVQQTAAVAIAGTLFGGMRLVDYLPTRTFELAVHTCDLARAIGEPLAVPASSAVEALTLVAGLAVHENHAGALLLAATGRRRLPEGFTVI